MNTDKIDKLKAQVDSLQDLLIRAYAKFLFFRPMMVNGQLNERMASEDRDAAFAQLRNWLYWDFIQELVKLCDDSDARTPSIRQLREALRDGETSRLLKDKYSRRTWPQGARENVELTRYLREQEEAELSKSFDETYRDFEIKCSELFSSDALTGYKTIRDKLIAHNELREVDGTYTFFDIKVLNLKYGNERMLLEMTREIIDGLDSLVRNSFFAWDSFFELQTEDVCKFWAIETIE